MYNFFEDYKDNIISLYNNYNIEISFEEFLNNCKLIFKNKYENSLLENNKFIYNDLFYEINEYCKSIHKVKIKKQIEYICPGCQSLGKNCLLESKGDNLFCKNCELSFLLETDSKMIDFFLKFKIHSKKGFKCPDCDRFIPLSVISNNTIICPYIDCCYSSVNFQNLKKIHHPTNKCNLVLTKNSSNELKTLIEIINNELITYHYTSQNSTLMHKTCACNAIKNCLIKYGESMINYLLHNSRTGGFQNKIFQEYICLLEKYMPFSFKKKNKFITINSLLDPELNIFQGISEFTTIVNKLEIQNNTKEFYIGSRKGKYCEKYYIGKLIDVIDLDTNISIIDFVDNYDFFKIKLKPDCKSKNVFVKHLMVYPHYQMGAMVYINRIRKNIVDKYKEIVVA